MHDRFVSVLSSGSSGNSMAVISDGSGVLIDAGISCKELERRLSLFGIDTSQIEAVLLTHEHTDHVRGARRFAATYGVPVYGTKGTLALSDLDGTRTVAFHHNKAFQIGPLMLKPFRVRHLAADPVAFSATIGSTRIGIASDLGCVTQAVVDEMSGSDLLFVEANYDDEMLLAGDYPEFLKRAIRGDHGHLSNDDAGRLASRAASANTSRVVLVHLSMENNTPDKARCAVEESLGRSKVEVDVSVAEHGAASGPFALS